jgi:uncharacterized protein
LPRTTTATFTMTSCFVDTGAFVALYDEGDSHHAEAVKLWTDLKSRNALLSTSRDVIVETIILLRRRAGHRAATAAGDGLWEGAVVDVIRPEPRQDRAAWDIFEKHADKELSFVDCLSFALMREFRLRRAFTFDKHFLQMGFEPLVVES